MQSAFRRIFAVFDILRILSGFVFLFLRKRKFTQRILNPAGVVHGIDLFPESGCAAHAEHIPGDMLAHFKKGFPLAIQLNFKAEVLEGRFHPFLRRGRHKSDTDRAERRLQHPN